MQAIEKMNLSDVVTDRAIPAWQFRLWSAPEVILMVTNFADEQTLLLEAIQQAKRSTAKILLAYVARPASSRRVFTHAVRQGRPQSTAHDAQVMLERMARQLRWAGIPSEPVLLQGLPAEEIPQLVRLRGVNRIIVTTQSDPRATGVGSRAIAEQILPRVTVPVSIVGSSKKAHAKFDSGHGSILLALSPQMQCELLLEFASRFARDMRASLNVLYVRGQDGAGTALRETGIRQPESHPVWLLKQAQAGSPFTTIFAEGDLVKQVLALQEVKMQDLILLGTEQTARSETSDEVSTAIRLAHEAPCPLLVLGNSAGKRGVELLSPQSSASQDAAFCRSVRAPETVSGLDQVLVQDPEDSSRRVERMGAQ